MNGLKQSDVVISNTVHQCHPELRILARVKCSETCPREGCVEPSDLPIIQETVSGSQKLRRFRNEFGMTINNSANSEKENNMKALIDLSTYQPINLKNKNVKNLMPYSLNSLLPKKKLAFTLAEVLITLGVIGIVAALTIPSLMSNYRKKVIETRLSKFYATINNAIKLAEYDYDDRTGWDELGSGFIKDENGDDTATPKAEAWVNKYLVPYIKGDTKMTNKNGCIELYFQDGSMVAINGAGWLFYPNAQRYKQIKDGSIDQGEAGKDFFIFFFSPNCYEDKKDNACKYIGDGVEPYKWNWDGTREGLFDGWYGCREAQSGGAHAYCTELIKQNNWKFPSDYPIKI